MNASILALRDGNFQWREENLGEASTRLEAPGGRAQADLRCYSIWRDGHDSGDRLGHSEKILVYGQVLEAMLIHTDRSEEVLLKLHILERCSLLRRPSTGPLQEVWIGS